MVLWRHRPLGYRVGFLALIFSILVYVIAYALPYWAVLRLRKYGFVDQTVGLWQACLVHSTTCIPNVHSSNPAWINATRATCTIALVVFAVVLWCGYYRNFSSAGQERCHSPGRHIEWLSITACLLGGAGSVTFACQFQQTYVLRAEVGHLHWAFPLVVCSLGLAAIASGFMVLFNRDRYHLQRYADTLRVQGPRGRPVTVQYSPEVGDHRLHIPYFGEISRDQVVPGAVPLQPPAYEMVTLGVGVGVGSYPAPPQDVSEAPPLYEDIAKDGVIPPDTVVRPVQSDDKSCAAAQADQADQGRGDPDTQ